MKTVSTKVCMQIFIGPLFIISKNWKQPNCMSSGAWINCGVSTQGILLTIKRDGLLILATTWINLKFSSVAQSCPSLCNPMDCRLSCPSPTPTACSNSCPSSWWCHSTISSSVIPFSSCLQLNTGSQTQKLHVAMIPFIRHSEKNKNIGLEK